MNKLETILVKGTFEKLGKIDLFPYSEVAKQITRRNDGCNKLVFSAEGFEFHQNFIDGESMKETKVIILDDFVSTGLPNAELDTVGEKIGIAKRFQGDRLSYYVGNYGAYTPEKLSTDLSVTYDFEAGYYQPKVLFLVEHNRISKVATLQLFSEDIYSLRKYVEDNRIEIAEYVKEGKYSLDTYIAGPGEQERERLSREALGIFNEPGYSEDKDDSVVRSKYGKIVDKYKAYVNDDYEYLAHEELKQFLYDATSASSFKDLTSFADYLFTAKEDKYWELCDIMTKFINDHFSEDDVISYFGLDD